VLLTGLIIAAIINRGQTTVYCSSVLHWEFAAEDAPTLRAMDRFWGNGIDPNRVSGRKHVGVRFKSSRSFWPIYCSHVAFRVWG